MKLTHILLILFLFLSSFYLAQVSITTSNYSQNFGTSTISSWTNNSTLSGWYLSAGGTFSFEGTINITNAAPSNNGGFYAYECNNDDNIKLGSRPSNTSGGSAGTGQSHIGLRLRNNTGQSIEAITVTYTAYQLSLAENYDGTTYSNLLTFSYQTAASVTSLTSGAWTSVAALNYTAPNNSTIFDGTASSQVLGYPCTVSQNLSQCINIPTLINGNEIMLRWTDINNNLNDPHLAIDNVQVLFHFDNACAMTLPIELISFTGNKSNNTNHLDWAVASERDNDYYTIEKSIDGLKWNNIGSVDGAGTINQNLEYEFIDYSPESVINYYRLSQTDLNGLSTDLKIIAIDNSAKKSVVKIFNLLGQEVDKYYRGFVIVLQQDGSTFTSYQP